MTILFSAFTGYNFRELLLPLKPLLDSDTAIRKIIVITPAADHRADLFPDFHNKYFFIQEQPDQAAYIKILNDHQPDCVITPTPGLEVKDIPLLDAAKQVSIPTLTFISSWDNVYKLARRIQLKKYHQEYAIADYFAVWNSINRDHLLKIIPDLSPEKITITGAPRLDYLLSDKLIPSRKQLLQSLRITTDNRPLIHLATTELYPSDYILAALHDLANFYVSVHPGGNLASHAKYAKPYQAQVDYSFGRRQSSPHPDFLYAPTLSDLYLHAALFKHSDLLINHSSTVTIESLLADTPVINVKYGRPIDWLRWYRSMVYRDFKQHAKIFLDSPATRVVTNQRQLIKATKSYLQHPEQDRQARRALAKKMVTFTDGSAGQRLLKAIKKLSL